MLTIIYSRDVNSGYSPMKLHLLYKNKYILQSQLKWSTLKYFNYLYISISYKKTNTLKNKKALYKTGLLMLQDVNHYNNSERMSCNSLVNLLLKRAASAPLITRWS